jgi:HEAT repeat protein
MRETASALVLVGLAVLALAIGACRSKLPYEGKGVIELERMLADPDPAVQARGAYGLGQHGAEARAAVPALAGALQSQHALVREYAAQALGRVGPDAAPAVSRLAVMLEDREWTVRRQAALALGKIGPSARSALPALEKLSRDAHRPVRVAAREAIKGIRP